MCYFLFFFLMIRRPPISTLFPYTTLFRSGGRLPLSYDRYAGVTGKYQRIGPGQSNDLFENTLVGTNLTVQSRQIDIGVDPKEIGRAHVRTPVTAKSRMPSSA